MGYEGRGMKLRDLVRNSQNPSFLSGLRIYIFRFGGKETTRGPRGSHELVIVSPFILPAYIPAENDHGPCS